MLIYKIRHLIAPLQMQHLLDWRQDKADMPCVRHRGPLVMPFARTKYQQHACKYFAPKLMNSLVMSHNVNLDSLISTHKANIVKVFADIQLSGLVYASKIKAVGNLHYLIDLRSKKRHYVCAPIPILFSRSSRPLWAVMLNLTQTDGPALLDCFRFHVSNIILTSSLSNYRSVHVNDGLWVLVIGSSYQM